MCDLLLRHASDAHALAHDPVVQASAQRWIEVLGEASTHVSEGLQAAHPEVPWRELAGMRVVLAHEYHHIDQDIVGGVVAQNIPTLRQQLAIVIGELPPDD